MNYELEQLFIGIITKGKKDNTYKFALAKYLLDKSRSQTIIQDIKIDYKDIAKAFLKYYWVQECKYKIKQDFKTKKQPMVINIIQNICGTEYISDSYNEYFKKNKKIKNDIIFNIEKECLKDVIPRFQPRDNNMFFIHNHILHPKGKKFVMPIENDRYIILNGKSITFFKNNYELLHKALILEWAKFLEKTNFTPRLISKIENLGENKRKSLLSFRKKLLEMKNHNCFYCNHDLEDKKIHVDHFIPWSYIYEDEIWNLVLSCSDCNSKKSDYLANEKCLDKLEKRNNINHLTVVNKDLREYYYNCKKSGFSIKNKELLCY